MKLTNTTVAVAHMSSQLPGLLLACGLQYTHKISVRLNM